MTGAEDTGAAGGLWSRIQCGTVAQRGGAVAAPAATPEAGQSVSQSAPAWGVGGNTRSRAAACRQGAHPAALASATMSLKEGPPATKLLKMYDSVPLKMPSTCGCIQD